MSTQMTLPLKKPGLTDGQPNAPRSVAQTLAGVCLELLDYITKHSDDSAELNDSVKWKLEAILRGTAP